MSRYYLIFSSPIKELDFLSPQITMAKYTTSSSTLIFQYYFLFLFVAPFSFPNIVFCYCLLHHSYFSILLFYFFCFTILIFHIFFFFFFYDHSLLSIFFFFFVFITLFFFHYFFLFFFIARL